MFNYYLCGRLRSCPRPSLWLRGLKGCWRVADWAVSAAERHCWCLQQKEWQVRMHFKELKSLMLQLTLKDDYHSFKWKMCIIKISTEDWADFCVLNEHNEVPGSWLVDGSAASSLCCAAESISVWLSKDDSMPALETHKMYAYCRLRTLKTRKKHIHKVIGPGNNFSAPFYDTVDTVQTLQ